MKILRGVVIDICTFMNTIEEWHSFVIGFCEIMCPWKSGIKPTELDYLQGEYHYYMFGRVIGFIALMGFMIGIIKAVF